MSIEFAGIAAQGQRLRQVIEARIAKVLDHGRFIRGPEVRELEQKLAAFIGVPHCVSCANGTDALQLALMVLGIGRGDEVVVPAFSFFATAEAVLLVGATPVFVDIDPETFCIDPVLVEAAITPRTRAVITVSLFGQCADVDALEHVAAEHGIALIEDAAQSFGATYKGRHSCSFGRIACTSFFPSKPLGCYGDGGALFTHDAALHDRLLALSQHGQVRRYRHEYVGMNSRLDTIQAAVLLEKLAVFEDEICARARVADSYAEVLAGLPLRLPEVLADSTSVWAQYTVCLQQRDLLARALQDVGIPTAVHYPLPLHRQPAIACDVTMPVSEHAASCVLSLPMHPYLAHEDVVRIGGVVRSFFAG